MADLDFCEDCECPVPVGVALCDLCSWWRDERGAEEAIGIEPATFAWTHGGYKARQAARRFAESADPAPGDPGTGEAGGA